MQIGAYYQVAFHMIRAILIKQIAKPLETTDYILFPPQQNRGLFMR